MRKVDNLKYPENQGQAGGNEKQQRANNEPSAGLGHDARQRCQAFIQGGGIQGCLREVNTKLASGVVSRKSLGLFKRQRLLCILKIMSDKLMPSLYAFSTRLPARKSASSCR